MKQLSPTALFARSQSTLSPLNNNISNRIFQEDITLRQGKNEYRIKTQNNVRSPQNMRV